MAKLPRNYRISKEVDELLKLESARLSKAQGKKVSEADVIEFAVVKWCSADNVNTDAENVNTLDPRAVAEEAMKAVELKPATPPLRKRAESVAERRAREAKDHAQKLAESDVLAQMTGRDDIEYDLENVPHRSVIHIATLDAIGPPRASGRGKAILEEWRAKRQGKTLKRPHGSTEAKRRRDQS